MKCINKNMYCPDIEFSVQFYSGNFVSDVSPKMHSAKKIDTNVNLKV